MTPEEYAMKALRNESIGRDYMHDAIVQAVRAAITEQKEKDAKIVIDRGRYKGIYTAIDPEITAKAIREQP